MGRVVNHAAMASPAPAPDSAPAPARHVLILGAAPVQLLDVAGPAEVLAQAGRLLGGGDGAAAAAAAYAADTLILPGPGLATNSAGLVLGSSVSAAEALGWEALDILIVIGGEGARNRAADTALQRLLRHLAPRARRVVSVCTGAFILAAGGLLDGRRVTTHWRWCGELARRHPALTVDPEPIFIRDGTLWTSAGVTAGMDLLLALVEEDHGHALALAVARELVLFLRRPGDQKQFSTMLAAQTGPSARLASLLAWMAENLHRPLPVEALAAQACLSPRQFARVFREETGMTPARLLEQLRVEAARQRLEAGRAGLAAITAACGFRTEETMRRAFLRQVGASPGDYRDRFRRGAPARIPP